MAADPFPFPNEVYPENWFRHLSVPEIFPEPDKPMEIDLGCGDGTFLIGMAEKFPERNFLGVERLLGRSRRVAKRITQGGLSNARIIRIDSNYGVEWLLPRGKATRLHFLCPDPWPKNKHASRRQMCRMEFLRSIYNLLTDDGEFLFKTDSKEYFDEAVEVLKTCDFFQAADWEQDSFFYPTTDFEAQWLAAGRQMNRIRLLKTN